MEKQKKPFVKPTLKEEASLTNVTLTSPDGEDQITVVSVI